MSHGIFGVRWGRGSGRGRRGVFAGSGGFADTGRGGFPGASAARLAGVVAEGGFGQEEAGGVEVIGDLGEGVAFVAQRGDPGHEEIDGFAEGEGIGNRVGEGIEVLANLLDSFGGERGEFLFGGHRVANRGP